MSGRDAQVDELLAQLGWVRAMARSLAANPDVGDDVLQQVCLLALQKAPHRGGSGPGLRAWLATATRRLASHASRAEDRRYRREHAAARDEALPSTIDLAMHREALRSLVQAVTALDEPLYSTVIARWFEGRDVAEIAAAQGISDEAVRKRLSRVRHQLRGHLGVELAKDEHRRLRAALPLLSLEAARHVGWLNLGGLAMAKTLGPVTITQLIVGLLVVACLFLGGWYELQEHDLVVTAPAGESESVALNRDEDVPPALAAHGTELPSPLAVTESPREAVAHPVAWPPDIVPFAISGRVVDKQGLPWSGAVVHLIPDTNTADVLGLEVFSYTLDLADFAAATTGADGRFALTGPWLPGRDWGRLVGLQVCPVILVQAEGMAAQAFPLLNHNGSDRDLGDLVLEVEGATLVARVVDEGGQPIEGAGAGIWSYKSDPSVRKRPEVSHAQSFNVMGLSRTRSDAMGRIVMAGLEACEGHVSFSDVRHASRQIKDVALRSGETTDLGDVVLDRSGAVSGTIRDAKGAPVADAAVWARKADDLGDVGRARLPPGDWERVDVLPAVLDDLQDSRSWHTSRAPVFSDAEGHFEHPGLTEENVVIVVEAPGFEAARLLDVPVNTSKIEIALQPEATLRVSVLDQSTGQTVAGAEVKAFRCLDAKVGSEESLDSLRRLKPSERRVTSEGPGRFLVHGIGPQGTRLDVAAPGYANLTTLVPGPTGAGLAMPAPQSGEAIARMQAESTLECVVQDVDGMPVAAARVALTDPSLTDRAEREEHRRAAWSGKDGRFRLDRLAAGAFSLQVEREGFASARDVAVAIPLAQHVKLPPIVLRRMARVGGKVRSADGRPTDGLVVKASGDDNGGSSIVDWTGTYEITGLSAGPLSLTVGELNGPPPYVTTSVTLADSEARSLDLMLPPLPVVHGRVTSAGRPVSGARVTAEELGSATNRQPAKFSQDGDTDGEFRLTFKQEGRFAVRATIPGGAASTPVPLDMAWGVDVPLDFELGTASIRGRVIDSDGTLAAAELKVRLQRDGQAATDWLEASAAGDFWFHPLLPGQYVVEVQGKAYPPTLGEHLEVGGAQQLEGVVVTVAKGAAIDGLILDAQGQPDASWVYLVRPVVPPVPEQLGAPKGVFRIEGLPPGRYKLIVAGATYADWWQDPHFEDLARASVKAEVEVELAAGEVRRVTLQSRE